MPQANYQTVFEIGLGSFPWAAAAHPLIFVAIGLVFVLFRKVKQIYLVVGVLVASVASLLFLMFLVVSIPDFIKLRRAYVSGESAIAEGVVENFRPAPGIGVARESFLVHGILFSYNALDDTPCFHNAPLHHGPIRDGLEVRIHYNEGCIQRVDLLLKSGLAK